MKKSVALILNLFISLSFVMAAAFPLTATAENGKVSLAIYPFNDVGRHSLDMNIPALFHAEFSGYAFIEIVPVEVIRNKIYEIEPQFMWTAKEDSVKKGGILWKIEPRVVEKINEAVNAQFSLYGDFTSSGESWTVDAFLIKDGEAESARPFSLTGLKYDELQAKLTDMSNSIAGLLKGDAELSGAEEEIRKYKGGMDSYAEVIGKMKKHISAVPESVPIRALLLDLYLEDKNSNREEIVSNGLKIIEMIKAPDNTDTRYILSLALDPFDAVAVIYEQRQERDKAIAIRDKALRLFPYNFELHKEGIGRDYYYIAKSFEEKGNRQKAMDNYKNAVTFLQSSSPDYEQSMEGIDRLKGKGVSSNQ